MVEGVGGVNRLRVRAHVCDGGRLGGELGVLCEYVCAHAYARPSNSNTPMLTHGQERRFSWGVIKLESDHYHPPSALERRIKAPIGLRKFNVNFSARGCVKYTSIIEWWYFIADFSFTSKLTFPILIKDVIMIPWP